MSQGSHSGAPQTLVEARTPTPPTVSAHPRVPGEEKRIGHIDDLFHLLKELEGASRMATRGSTRFVRSVPSTARIGPSMHLR